MNDEAVSAALRNLGDSMSEFRQENADQHRAIMEKQDTTNGRLTALEKWQAQLQGAGTAIRAAWVMGVAIAGIVGGMFGDIIVQHFTGK